MRLDMLLQGDIRDQRRQQIVGESVHRVVNGRCIGAVVIGGTR